MSNSDGSTSNGYQDVENVLVANNTVIDSVNSINLFAGSRSQKPDSVYFVNNVVMDAIGPVIKNADTLPDNSTFAGNYVSGQSLRDDNSQTTINGFIFIDPQLEVANDMLFRPADNSPGLSAELSADIGLYALPLVDMDGQIRSANTIAGADETLAQNLEVTSGKRGLKSTVGWSAYLRPS